MSNRRRLPAPPVLRMPGGCADCDAYQTLDQDGRVAVLTIHHDATCPWLAAREGQQ